MLPSVSSPAASSASSREAMSMRGGAGLGFGQAGHVKHYKSAQKGERTTIAERAYCEGFVRPHEADEILRWMWAHTDKYAVKMQVGDDVVDDKVFADVGVFGVTTKDGGATWPTKR